MVYEQRSSVFPAYMPFLLFSKEGIRVKLAFTKMHGCGNNYIYFNCFDQTVPDPESLSIQSSVSRTSVSAATALSLFSFRQGGCADAYLQRRRSEGKMCGNGIRCVGKYLYDNGNDRWPHHHHH